MRRGEEGVALIETMIAIVVLSLAGVSVVGTVANALRDHASMARRERTLGTAERVLSATTLLTRTDLDRRLGRRRIGEFFVDVQRPERELYRMAVSEVAAPDVELLVTVVYRRSGGQAVSGTGGQAVRRSVGQAVRRSVGQADRGTGGQTKEEYERRP